MNNNFDLIEIINFDSMSNEHELSIDNNNDIEMSYLNNFLLEKYDSEYESQLDNSFLPDVQSQISFLSEYPTSKVNSSLCSSAANDIDSETSKSTRETSPVEAPCETPEKQFRCSYETCKKSFKFRWILDRHYLSHKSIKHYKCIYKGCPKSYKSKENLTLHVKNIHLKQKPYSCRFCPSLFSHRNGKTYHERKFHTNYLPHKCQIIECNSNFASKSALTYHLKSQHSDKPSRKLNRSKFTQQLLNVLNEYDNNEFNSNNIIDYNIEGELNSGNIEYSFSNNSNGITR